MARCAPRKARFNLPAASTLLLACCISNARADDLTLMIEEHLASLGYDTGTVDGEADVKTAVAISQFQAEKGLEVTGVVSPQLAGVLSAEVDKGISSAAAGTASSPVTQQSSPTSQMNAAQQQVCLQQKIAAAQQAQPKQKKGLGGAFSSLAKTVAKYGGDDVAKASAEIVEAGATVNDLAEAARELGISESDIADCQPSTVQVAGGAAVAGAGAAAATAPQPVGQNVRYAQQGAFQAASYKLGQFDAMLQACTGARPAFRAEVDSLVTAAHPGYRAEALTLYDSQYQSTNQMLSSASVGSCHDAQIASIRSQADTTLESLRPKVIPSAPAVKSASVSTVEAGAGASTSVSNTSPSPGQPVAIEADSASLRAKMEHCEIMRESVTGSGGSRGVPGKGSLGGHKTNTGLKTCIGVCRGAFEYSLERSRPASPNMIGRGISECHDIHRQAVAEYQVILTDFNALRSKHAALRQQVVAEYSARGLSPDQTFGGHIRVCEQQGGEDCDAYAKCRSTEPHGSITCSVIFHGGGGNEATWEDARDGLIVRGETIDFDKMSAVLPAEMSRAIAAEGVAYEAECNRKEAYRQNKLKNCACYKDIYLDERMKTRRFDLRVKGDFDQNLMRDKTWARCINEEGYRDYLMRNCMGPVSGQGPAKEAAQKPYCECQMEPMLDEIKVQTEYANSIDATKVTQRAFQACRALKP